ncbi:NUDIX hydrolase [Rhizobium leguminosarum]|uniref:NUDIX hydrolase n=1 Tax=Rhizobium leguminosarum TaxID=384 RepID=UPI002F94307B
MPQAAAICLIAQSRGGPHIVLVRSRRTGQWGLPKGGIEPGEISPRTAEREAFEEAGVTGAVCLRPIGHFGYEKEGNCDHYQVAVHVLLNDRLADCYPESGIRERGLFPLADAIDMVLHPQVRRILAQLLDEYHSH